MGTIAETGAPWALDPGHQEQHIYLDDEPTIPVTIIAGDSSSFMRANRNATTFRLDEEPVPDPDGNFTIFAQPLGSSASLDGSESTRTPLFGEAWQRRRGTGSDVVVIDDENPLSFDSRDAIEAFIGPSDERQPSLLIVGAETHKRFIEDVLAVLDIHDPAPPEVTDGRVKITDDDRLASQVIEIAGQQRLDVRGSIPPGHHDRMTTAAALHTMIEHYQFHCTTEDIGSQGGNWQQGFQRFAAAYGVTAGEFADIFMMYAPEIARAANERLATRNERFGWDAPETMPELTEEVALQAANWLVNHIDPNR